MAMNYQKALDVLGLKRGYTQDEKIKAYRRLSKVFHPDSNMDKSENVRKQMEIKMKEVNEARDFLDKLDKKRENPTNSYEELEKLKVQYIRIIESFERLDTKFEENNFVHAFYEDIKLVVFEFKLKLVTCLDKGLLEELLSSFKEKVKEYYLEMLEEFCLDNTDIFPHELNFDVSIGDFYQQLLDINIRNITKEINDEIFKYQQYVGFDDLKVKIENICNEAIVIIKNGNLEYLNALLIIKNMHQEILDLFKIYHDLKKKLADLKELIANVDDEALQNKYEELNKKFLEGSLNNNLNKEIDELLSQIAAYQKKIKARENLEKNSLVIEGLFQRVLGRANEVLSTLSITKNYEQINYIYNTQKALLNLFRKVLKGEIDIDVLMMLDNLTFTDMLSDANIIKAIDSNSSLVTNSNIYLKKCAFCNAFTFDAENFFVLEQENGHYYMLYKNLTFFTKKEVTSEEVKNQYISLDEFFDNAEFLGMYAKRHKLIPIMVLFNDDNSIIYLDLEHKNIGVCSADEGFTNWSTCKDQELIREYSDKEYVKMLIVNQFQKQLEESKIGRS